MKLLEAYLKGQWIIKYKLFCKRSVEKQLFSTNDLALIQTHGHSFCCFAHSREITTGPKSNHNLKSISAVEFPCALLAYSILLAIYWSLVSAGHWSEAAEDVVI